MKIEKQLEKDGRSLLEVDREQLMFNDKVHLSDRVYKTWADQVVDEDSIDSNHAPLYCVAAEDRPF